ncbi:SCP2 sterol-binding domain-containing protein [Salinisphaera sp. T31B1]|uniref:SCP2 sterol-binding domain-containing protein n=1 Tax=Salinisphaera sp. T31B1 TaxID=727963 RepID=UPI003342D086
MSRATELIQRMPEAFDPDAAGDLSMTVQYLIEEPMYVVVDRGSCRVHTGIATDPDVTLRIKGEHLVRLMTGRMRGITAFLTGKLRVEGNMMLAQKLQQIFDRRRLA